MRSSFNPRTAGKVQICTCPRVFEYLIDPRDSKNKPNAHFSRDQFWMLWRSPRECSSFPYLETIKGILRGKIGDFLHTRMQHQFPVTGLSLQTLAAVCTFSNTTDLDMTMSTMFDVGDDYRFNIAATKLELKITFWTASDGAAIPTTVPKFSTMPDLVDTVDIARRWYKLPKFKILTRSVSMAAILNLGRRPTSDTHNVDRDRNVLTDKVTLNPVIANSGVARRASRPCHPHLECKFCF